MTTKIEHGIWAELSCGCMYQYCQSFFFANHYAWLSVSYCEKHYGNVLVEIPNNNKRLVNAQIYTQRKDDENENEFNLRTS